MFVGEPSTTCDFDRVAEVAVALRTGIPLPVEIVEESVSDLRGTAPRGIEVEVLDGDDVESGTSVWAVAFLDRVEVNDGTFAHAMVEILAFARSYQAHAI